MLADGTEVVYLRRRFVPPPESLFALMPEHVVVQGDRLDNIAARYLGDPEQFWRICDANRAMRPAALTEELGRRLRITAARGHAGSAAVFDALHLTLMIGPLRAAAAGAAAGDRGAAAASRSRAARIAAASRSPSRMGKTSPLQLALLPAGFFDPMITRVVIIATFTRHTDGAHGRRHHAAGDAAWQSSPGSRRSRSPAKT